MIINYNTIYSTKNMTKNIIGLVLFDLDHVLNIKPQLIAVLSFFEPCFRHFLQARPALLTFAHAPTDSDS